MVCILKYAYFKVTIKYKLKNYLRIPCNILFVMYFIVIINCNQIPPKTHRNLWLKFNKIFSLSSYWNEYLPDLQFGHHFYFKISDFGKGLVERGILSVLSRILFTAFNSWQIKDTVWNNKNISVRSWYLGMRWVELGANS